MHRPPPPRHSPTVDAARLVAAFAVVPLALALVEVASALARLAGSVGLRGALLLALPVAVCLPALALAAGRLARRGDRA